MRGLLISQCFQDHLYQGKSVARQTVISLKKSKLHCLKISICCLPMFIYAYILKVSLSGEFNYYRDDISKLLKVYSTITYLSNFRQILDVGTQC